MKKHLIGSIDLKDKLQCPEPVVVEYFRTETEDWEECYGTKKPIGIEVVKNELLNGVTYREIKTITHIGDDVKKVDSILEILCRNSVTPVCVADVLEDMKLI
mgnify:CR=1 FL=1